MGNSASKAARTYPTTRKELPSHISRSGQKLPHVDSALQRDRLADSQRTEAIEKDAGDPDFLANLNRLGPVRVDHHMKTTRQEKETSQTARLFDSRAKSELELASAGPAAKTMYAFSLSELLDRRKAARSAQDVQRLCEEYGIAPRKLESLARYVNSPSINSASIRPISGKSEEEGFMATAVWIEPQAGSK